MLIIVLIIAISVVNYFVITTVIDVILMGKLHFQSKQKTDFAQAMITKENRIDIQSGFQCSAYSSAFVLRHFGIDAFGKDVYQEMPNKMKNGYVYPKGIVNLMHQYGLGCEYCAGNLDSLKSQLAKGNPVIVMIKVYQDKNWLHYVPVVGYDETNIYIAESLPELVNCNEEHYNRCVKNTEFLKLWNTCMIKQPLYRYTYFKIDDGKVQ